MQWRRRAQPDVVVLTVLYFMSALLWVPRVVWVSAQTCAGIGPIPAPKGESDDDTVSVSLKRYPDTKPGFFRIAEQAAEK